MPAPKPTFANSNKEFNAAYAANDLDKYFGYYADDARAVVSGGPDGCAELQKNVGRDYIKGGAESFSPPRCPSTHIRS